MPQADPPTALRACRRTNVGVPPSDVGEALAAMTHGSHGAGPAAPAHRHDVGACELPLPRDLEPVAFAIRHKEPCARDGASRLLSGESGSLTKVA
jgi:hypothetical protein